MSPRMRMVLSILIAVIWLEGAATCGKERTPVCGCDGVTYQNECLRLTSKMQKDHDGECRDEPDEP